MVKVGGHETVLEVVDEVETVVDEEVGLIFWGVVINF